jgi:aminoglycoside 6-adenylyltransferase
MDQSATLEQVLNWARSDENVRALVLTGSVASGEEDERSDLDIELYVADQSPLLNGKGWYPRFGEVLVVEELENPGWYPTRLVYYTQGKIDFTVAPVSALASGIAYTRPFKVLVDKDDLGSAATRVPARTDPPSADEFARCVNWFYAAAIMWGLHLSRADPWAVKIRDRDAKEQLLAMIEWDHKARYGFDYDTFFGGAHLQEWTDPDIREAIPKCWSDFSIDHSTEALMATLDLFAMLSRRTAAALGFSEFDDSGVRRRVELLLRDDRAARE